MKGKILSIFGVLIAISSVWVGSYFLNEYPPGEWQSLPVFFSCFVSFVAGFALAVSNIESWDK